MNIEKTFKALADKNRLRIMNLLLRSELCVCEIEEILGLSQTNASRHLTKLSQSGLLESRKEAQWVFYRISDDFIKKHNALIQYLTSSFNQDEVFIRDYHKLSKASISKKPLGALRCERS